MSRKEIIRHQKTTVRFTRLSFTELRLQLVNSSSDAIQRPPHSQITPVRVQIFTGRIWTICLLFWLNLSWFILRGSALQQAHKEQKLVSVASSRVRLSSENLRINYRPAAGNPESISDLCAGYYWWCDSAPPQILWIMWPTILTRWCVNGSVFCSARSAVPSEMDSCRWFRRKWIFLTAVAYLLKWVDWLWSSANVCWVLLDHSGFVRWR